MKPQVEAIVVCSLLLMCEAGGASPRAESPSLEVIMPTAVAEPLPTPTPTQIPTSTVMPWPTCTTMPWPTDTPVPEVVVIGRASQYAPGVMERVIESRQKWGQLPPDVNGYDGYVAARECADVGRVMWLRPCGATEWEVFLIVDCASKTDRQSEADNRSGYEWMRDRNVLAEIDFDTAARWDTIDAVACIEMLISGGA